jgi:hypothetical protein
MSNSFRKRYPDFAAIEQHIRRAHAERQVAIAAAFADAIIGAVRGIGRLFSAKPATRTAAGRVPVEATVRTAARV